MFGRKKDQKKKKKKKEVDKFVVASYDDDCCFDLKSSEPTFDYEVGFGFVVGVGSVWCRRGTNVVLLGERRVNNGAAEPCGIEPNQSCNHREREREREMNGWRRHGRGLHVHPVHEERRRRRRGAARVGR